MDESGNIPDLPSWLDGYLVGVERGRVDERRAESERWSRESRVRPGLLEPAASVIIDGQRVTRWTWRERAEQRRAVIREAHAAGLHGAGARYCPECPR